MQKTLILLTACCLSASTIAQNEMTDININDPWEKFNRPIHSFNMKIDQWLLLPASKAYQKVTPKIIDNSITNFFNNINVIPTMINDLLQLELADAGSDLLRFGANTTFGLLGLFDIATKIDIPYEKEDFGLTLAKWGVPSGPYLTLPLLGPSTVRDAIGLVPEQTLSPIYYIDYQPTKSTVNAIYFLDRRADLIALTELITGDSYNFLRDSYLQTRDAIIKGGVVDDFGEEEFDQEFDDF